MFQHFIPFHWWIIWFVNKLSYLCSHQLKGIWVASISGLFWIVLLSTAMDKFLCQCAFSFSNTRNVSTPGIELLGQITPHVTFSFYITTTNVRTFQILHTLTFSCCLSLILIRKWVLSSTSLQFQFAFPNEEWCWASFHVLINPFFGEMSIQINHPFLIQLLLFLLLKIKTSLYRHKFFVWYMICKYSLSSCGLSFGFLDGVICSIF